MCKGYIHDPMIKLIYKHLASIFTSIITLFIRLPNVCIMIRLNHGDYSLYHEFIYYCCISFNYSMMIYLSVMAVEITIYDIVHWITQYFNDFNHKFDENKSNNDRKYQFNGNMGVSVLSDCILMCMMSVFDK